MNIKKYFQITFFLAIFGLAVLVRQIKGNETPRVIGNNNTVVIPTATPTLIPTDTPVLPQNSNVTPLPTATPAPKPKGQYKDGNYTGSVEDAFYGNIQVQVNISNGKITDVVFLQFPNDNRTSQFINSQEDPMLTQEAIQKQSANVDIVSGASASSQAFQASLANALAKAKN